LKPSRAKQPKSNGKAFPWCYASGSSATSWKEICVHGRVMEDTYKLTYVSPSVNSDGKSYAKIDRSEL